MRDRLIELIESARYWGANTSEEIADYLLDEGVIVPPAELGQTVYITVHPFTLLPLKKVEKGYVISIHKNDFGLFIKVLFDTKKINGCFEYSVHTWRERIFSTREEAEKALTERREG